jgi:hypothetical protein
MRDFIRFLIGIVGLLLYGIAIIVAIVVVLVIGVAIFWLAWQAALLVGIPEDFFLEKCAA